jgi:hypothetical protein
MQRETKVVLIVETDLVLDTGTKGFDADVYRGLMEDVRKYVAIQTQ